MNFDELIDKASKNFSRMEVKLNGGYFQVEHADVLLSWNTRLPSMDKA